MHQDKRELPAGEPDDRTEAAMIRLAILEGYRDAIEGRMVEYHGDLRQLLRSPDPESDATDGVI